MLILFRYLGRQALRWINDYIETRRRIEFLGVGVRDDFRALHSRNELDWSSVPLEETTPLEIELSD
jgi:hypothetical protein